MTPHLIGELVGFKVKEVGLVSVREGRRFDRYLDELRIKRIGFVSIGEEAGQVVGRPLPVRRGPPPPPKRLSVVAGRIFSERSSLRP
jgi:hypothetical protein